VQAAVEGFDGGDGVFGARVGEAEYVAAHLLQLGALGFDQLAQQAGLDDGKRAAVVYTP
jgi:hypothetical protein